MYSWNWHIISEYRSVFVGGALVTIGLALVTIFFGTALGIVLALLRRSHDTILCYSAAVCIAVFQALPIIVLLIWIFYVLPLLTGWVLTSFIAATIALSLHLSAFVAETLRAGIESVPKHQFESGIVLGLSPARTMLHIIAPQAVRNILPNLLGLYVTQLKNTSLTSIIAVNELLHMANTVISATFRPLEVYTSVALIYVALVLPLTVMTRKLEKAYKKNIKTL